MKRILSFILIFCLLFLSSGCKEEVKTQADPLNIKNIVDMSKVRDLEEISSFNELNSDEELYYNYLFIESVKTLDIDTLSKMLINDPLSLEYLKVIKNDPERKSLWGKTIGQYIYLPQSRQLIYPSTMHIYCMWMDYAYSNTGFTANEITQYDYQEVINFYNNYYNRAFLISKHIDIKTIYSLNLFLYEELGIVDLNTAAYGALFQYIFPEIEYGFETQDYIREDGCFKDWAHFKDLNIDRMIPIIESTIEDESDFANEFNYYFKDEVNKKKIQKFLDEEGKVYRTAVNITYFIPASKETMNLSEAENEYIKDLKIYRFGSFVDFLSYEYMLSPIIKSVVENKIVTAYIQ